MRSGLRPKPRTLLYNLGPALGFESSILACIDFKDAKRKWKGRRYGRGQLVLLPDKGATSPSCWGTATIPFSPAIGQPAANSAYFVTAGDSDWDGKPDLAVAASAVTMSANTI